jgi:hypothetical protein
MVSLAVSCSLIASTFLIAFFIIPLMPHRLSLLCPHIVILFCANSEEPNSPQMPQKAPIK